MKDPWKEYFAFSRKERAGIVILLLLIATSVMLPFFFRNPAVSPDGAVFHRIREQLAGLEQNSSTQRTRPIASGVPSTQTLQLSQQTTASIPELFPFDPHSISTEEWRRLGLPQKTISTIQNYLAKGGRFRQPADLAKIYGLRPDDAKRIIPYVRIEASSDVQERKVFSSRFRDTFAFKRSPKKLVPVDINKADTTEWIALPGIGNRLAQRIINFREKLGGFYSVAQVGETYGLPDSTFQKIKPMLLCDQRDVRTININTAGEDLLKQHPYIRWNIAKAIVLYRQQHGPFVTLESLDRIALIPAEWRAKTGPYLSLSE